MPPESDVRHALKRIDRIAPAINFRIVNTVQNSSSVVEMHDYRFAREKPNRLLLSDEVRMQVSSPSNGVVNVR